MSDSPINTICSRGPFPPHCILTYCQLPNNLEFDVVFRRSDVKVSVYLRTTGISSRLPCCVVQRPVKAALCLHPRTYSLNNTHQSETPLHLPSYVMFCSSLPHFSHCTWSFPSFRQFVEYAEILRANRVRRRGRRGLKGVVFRRVLLLTDKHTRDLYILPFWEMKQYAT